MFQYFAIYKPYNYLSQFSKEKDTDNSLADLHNFPKDVYPVGRLDKDSEGLIFLTNDPSINDALLNPKNNKTKKYWAQVDGEINESAIARLSAGVEIKIEGVKYKTLPAKVKKINSDLNVPERTPPIRVRINIPTSWIEIVIKEGKNRQIRKMCATIGFPALRLIRVGIGNYDLDTLVPSEVKLITKNDMLS